MRVAIITLPLHTNYGGLLQAYALKKCIEKTQGIFPFLYFLLELIYNM